MTDTSTRNRQPRGVATGGQFARETRAEVDGLALSAPSRTRFTTAPMLSVGGRSPWGEIQDVDRVADGIEFASTDGHGGYKLSADRNRAVPAPLRRNGGWYEEDCERHIVEFTFPGETGRDADQAAAGVKDWYPDQFSEVTGEAVTPEESHELRRRAEEADRAAAQSQHEAAHQDRDLPTGHYNDDYTPEGFTIYQTQRPEDGTTRYYLAPHRHDQQVALDGFAGASDITELHEEYLAASRADTGLQSSVELPEPVSDLGIDTGSLTPAARKIAEKELDALYRFPAEDGTTYVASMRQNLERHEAVHGKTVMWDGAKSNYCIQLNDSYVRPVKKATWDALAGVPDTTTELGYAELEASRSRAAYEKAQDQVTEAMTSRDWNRNLGQLRKKSEAAAKKLEDARTTRDTLYSRGQKARTERTQQFRQRLAEVTQN